jgi:hypothetical protein
MRVSSFMVSGLALIFLASTSAQAGEARVRVQTRSDATGAIRCPDLARPGASECAPGQIKKRKNMQSARQYAPGQKKDDDESARTYAPGRRAN